MAELNQKLRDAAEKGDLEEVTRLRDQGAQVDGADKVILGIFAYRSGVRDMLTGFFIMLGKNTGTKISFINSI